MIFIAVSLLFSSLLIAVNSQSVSNVCFCVTSGYCNNNSGGNNNNDFGNGASSIDIRIQTNSNPSSSSSGSSFQLTNPVSSGINLIVNNQQSCQNGLERCCANAGYQCGMRYPPIQGAQIPASGSGQSQYGSYPWMAVIVTQDQTFQGTGALIDHMHVLTVAHKLNQSTVFNQQLTVVMGEWDGSANSEIIPSKTFQVQRVFVHPQVNYGNLRNDVAILRLSQSVNLGETPTITNICLPSSQIPMNIRCWIAGWGVNNYGGQFQTIQKEVDVPLIDQNACQNQLRATRLGTNFVLDTTSFICAGGESGKDACTGDGGAPLVCQISNQWYVIGLVAWGIGCGNSNVPGVYVNVASYVNWIQQTTRS